MTNSKLKVGFFINPVNKMSNEANQPASKKRCWVSNVIVPWPGPSF